MVLWRSPVPFLIVFYLLIPNKIIINIFYNLKNNPLLVNYLKSYIIDTTGNESPGKEWNNHSGTESRSSFLNKNDGLDSSKISSNSVSSENEM